MKKFGLLIITAALLSVLFSCKDPFFEPPFIPSEHEGSGGGQSGIPNGISASHGEKRAIGISWNEDSYASFYYIYSADSPLNTFTRCGETSSAQIKFNVQPGSTMYYRISSVSHDGIESPLSGYVRGTSLAQPVISDITDVDEAGAAVTWYMDNVYEETYKNSLLYTVYCFNGTTEVAQVAVDGASLNENKVFVSGLNANTRYEYQVEAYLRSDQSASEKSDKMDAATARRFRPGAPLKPWADRGRAKNSVMLSFELPELVDIALGDNQYEPKPIYFKISKRQYSETHSNEFVEVCSYFGSIGEKAAGAFNGQAFDGGYEPGKWVSWNDTGAGVRRGVKYEYLIQSYVDDTTKIISSDTSKANAVGWALSDGTLSFGRLSYLLNDDEDIDMYVSAKLPLDFEFDPMGEDYSYVLFETITAIDTPRSENDPDDDITGSVPFSTYNAIRAYTREMDLTKKTTEHNPGRGIYSYRVEIRIGDEMLDSFATIGRIEVSEDTQPVIVEEFHVQDGYADKFIFKWPRHSNRKYVLYKSIDGNPPWNEIMSIEPSSTDDDATLDENYLCTVDGYSSGISTFFAIRAERDKGDGTFKAGQYVYFPTVSMTLGVPQVQQITDYSYSTINVVWNETQKADTYRIMYRYEDQNWQTAGTAAKENISIDINGHYKFPFKPEGYNDVTKAGREIQIQVAALNEGLRASVGGAEISTSSAEDVKTKLVGPALLDLQAGRAASAEEIDVSWNKVSGAGGYYVFRRQFNMNNSAEEGSEEVVYYIPAEESSSIIITGKSLALDSSNAKIDTTTVKASASFAGSRYSLKDKIMADDEYGVPLAPGGIYNRHTVGYKNQQNDMMQGYPYRYYVVPVLANESLSSIEFAYAKDGSNKNTSITSYTIRDNGANIQFNGASALEKEGFVVGFGQNITATKGTYASSGNSNDAILITWEKPPLLAPDNIISYTLYRKETGGSWQPLNSSSVLQFIDTPTPNVAYEYMVGIDTAGGVSNPVVSARFIELCGNIKERNMPKNLGFHVAMIKTRSVSRNEQKVGNDFAEEVQWESTGIKNPFSTDNNWGIDGYTIFVMNRDINDGWNEIADIKGGYLSNVVLPTFKVTNVQGGAIVQGGLLKVSRNYKHFFKVRSYVLKDNGDKVYSPDPPYEYKYWNGNAANNSGSLNTNIETDYVKWGARQVTALEFVQICSGYLSRGFEFFTAGNQNNGWRSTWYLDWFTYKQGWNGWDVAANYGATGRINGATNQNGPGDWLFEFRNYKPDMRIVAPQYNGSAEVWQTFISIDGDLWLSTNTNTAHPRIYGQTTSNYREKWLQITGPGDVSMYTGRIKIGGGVDDVEWDKATGGIAVIYPEETAQQRIATDGHNIALSFQNRENRFFHDEAPWK